MSALTTTTTTTSLTSLPLISDRVLVACPFTDLLGLWRQGSEVLLGWFGQKLLFWYQVFLRISCVVF